MLKRRIVVAASCGLLVTSFGCSRKLASLASPDASAFLPDDLRATLSAASGHVESTGSSGTWKLEKGTCYAGDNDGYFGIQVQSEADSHVFVKLVKDPIEGWTLMTSIPDTCKGTKCTLEVFHPDDCKPLDVDLKVYTFKTRGTHQFDGDATFDCTRGKAHVAGKLTVSKCVN